MSFYVVICLTVAAVKKEEKRVRLKYIVKVAGVCVCVCTQVYTMFMYAIHCTVTWLPPQYHCVKKVQ